MSNSAIQVLPGAEGQRGAAAERNVIINGQFDIWQRGTSFSGSIGLPPTEVIFTADRWNSSGSGGAPAVPIGNITVNQIDQITFDPGQTDVPDNPTFYLQRQVIILGGGTTDASILGVFIEDVRTFNGQRATMSFWAKGNIPGDLAVNFTQRFGVGGSLGVLTSEQFFSVTSTWRKYVLFFDVPSIAGKTIGTTADGLQIRFYSHAGNAVFTSGLPVDYTGEFCITNVQFEEGEVVDPDFENRSPALELQLAQRYYETGQSSVVAWTGPLQEFDHHVNFRVIKRGVPSITTVDNVTINVSPLSPTFNITDHEFFYNRDIVVGPVSGKLEYNWIADAEVV